MASLLSSTKLGNASPTSLVKSASSLQTTINDYQDKVQAAQFATDSSDTSFNEYKSYLTNRINTLNSSGTIADLSKAVSLTTALNTAFKTNTTFNIDQISIQMMAGNASDQTKLDYLTKNVLTNPLVQSNTDMYAKYEQQAYSLQQSIQYQSQVQQNAAITQQTAEMTAQAQGFKSSNAQIDAAWKTLQGAYQTGDTKDIKTGYDAFVKVVQSTGVQVPQGASSNLNIAKLGYTFAKIANYENIANAEPNTPTGISAAASAESTRFSADTYKTLSDALAPTQLYSPSVNANGSVSQSENAVTGYKRETMKTPFGDITVTVPQSNGDVESQYHKFVTENSANKANFDNKLQSSLGLKKITNSDKSVQYEVTSQTPKWFLDSGNITVGEKLTAIPTAKGFQFTTGISGNAYGVSFDSKGLPALFKQDTGGNFQHVGGAYGFNDKLGGGIQTAVNLPSEGTKAVVNHVITQMFGTPGQPRMVQRTGGGFNFTDATGKAISAAQYALLTHQQFRGLLNTMAVKGDTGAKQVLGFVGNDMKYDPTKIGQGNNAQIYNAMTYGAEPNAKVSAPTVNSAAPGAKGGSLSLPSGFKL